MTTQRISALELLPGMVLAEELANENGQRLLGAGVVLNDRIIAVLRQNGVPAVSVQVPESEEEAQERQTRRRALVAELDRRFSHACGRPAMEAIRKALLRHLSRAGGDA